MTDTTDTTEQITGSIPSRGDVLVEPGSAPRQEGAGRPGRWKRFKAKKLAWNTVEDDFALDFPCDRHVTKPYSPPWFRAIDIDAPRSVVWRWLCQLRVAPYSYDWIAIGNLGRRCPRKLTPGVEDLEPGQRILTIFEVIEFEPEEQLTLGLSVGQSVWGRDVACTYRLVDRGEGRCRLVFKLQPHRREGRVHDLRRAVFPWGELVMTRKQLLNMKKLSEETARELTEPESESVRRRGLLGRARDRLQKVKYGWNTTEADHDHDFPCDRHIPEPHSRPWFRAVDIDAPRSVVWRWLCQLRVGPYSYDLIDNLGRRCPRELTPGVEDLEPGQRMMTLFEVIEFEPEEQLTLGCRWPRNLQGIVACTYRLVEQGEDRCRLVFKLQPHYIAGLKYSLRRAVLPWVELPMSRKQLLTMKKLAEKTARGG